MGKRDKQRAHSFCEHRPNVELPGSWLKEFAKPELVIAARAASQTSQQQQDKRVWRISYLANVRGSAECARRKVDAAVEKLEKKNIEMNVSGHMCYDAISQQVWQVLEGTPQDIEKAWAAIQKDQTHDIVEDAVRFEDDVNARRYTSGWGFSSFGQKSTAKAPDAKVMCIGVECLMKKNEESGRKLPADKKIIQLRYKAFVEHADESYNQAAIPETIKNSQLDVTGLLLFHENSMTTYQVLEGRDSDVEQLWSTLRQDPGQRIVSDSVSMRAISDRQFSELSVDHVELSRWSAGPGY